MENLNKVKELEKEIGVVLIAYKPTEYATLDDKEVQDLQDLEKKMKATIIAFR